MCDREVDLQFRDRPLRHIYNTPCMHAYGVGRRSAIFRLIPTPTCMHDATWIVNLFKYIDFVFKFIYQSETHTQCCLEKLIKPRIVTPRSELTRNKLKDSFLQNAKHLSAI